MKRLAALAVLGSLAVVPTGGASAQTVSNTQLDRDLGTLAGDSEAIATLATQPRNSTWASDLKKLEALEAGAEVKVNADLAPKPKPVPANAWHVVATSTAVGSNAQANVNPSNSYTGRLELIVTATPPQPGFLNWNVSCFNADGSQPGNQGQENVNFPVTKVLVLPVQGASGGCSAVAWATLNGPGGSVTLRLATTGSVDNNS